MRLRRASPNQLRARPPLRGDLDVTSKALAEDIKELQGLHHNCMTKAEEFEAETKSRGEPKALATKKIVKEATGAALDQTDCQRLRR